MFSRKAVMIMKHPGLKGKGYELKVAKILTNWCGHEFHRTPASGALHWSNDKRVTSDIVPPPNLKYPFSTECKNQEVPWDFDFILKGTSTLWEFWEQASSDANDEEMIPMLLITKNYRDSYAAIPTDVFLLLFKNKNKPNYITISHEKYELGITLVSFSELLTSCSLEDFQKLI